MKHWIDNRRTENVWTLEELRKVGGTKPFTVMTTFSGCGGSATGYHLAGAKVIAALEFMEVAQKIYAKNYPNTHIFKEDIRKLTGEQILEQLGLEKGELDILDGSPPCASFSTSGLREKAWGQEKKYSKTTQRVDDLFFEFARILKEVQPKVFVAENVKGLTIGNAKKICGSKSKRLDAFFDIEHERESIVDEDEDIVNTLRQCGYKVSFRVLSAQNFGAAQNRERTIFIGVREDLNIKPSFPNTLNNYDKNPITAKELILPYLFYGTQFTMNRDTLTYKYINEVFLPGYSISDCNKKAEKLGIKTFIQKFKRDNWHNVHYTLVQQPEFHGVVSRFASLEESLLIGSFPKDYKLNVPIRKKHLVSVNDLIDYHNGNKDLDKIIDKEYTKLDGLDLTIDEIKLICQRADIPEKYWDVKMFYLPLKENENSGEFTEKHSFMGAREFIGRSHAPLQTKAIGEHIYNNILSRIGK